jgi:putative membrane protein
MTHGQRADRFFTGEEKERLKEAAIDAESRTVGEIAIMVIDQSSQYPEAEVLGAIFLSGMVSLGLTAWLFHGLVWFFIPLLFLLFFPARLLFKTIPRLKHFFVGRNRLEKAVKERAVRAFYERGLYKTKEHSGVLFFLSLLERKVWVLADKGIHGKIHQPTLNKFAGMIARGIKEGRPCDALIEAVHGMGDLLAEHYPVAGRKVDQLPDEIICETDGECG